MPAAISRPAQRKVGTRTSSSGTYGTAGCRRPVIYAGPATLTTLRVIRVLFLAYLGYGGLMYARQESILFPAASDDRHPLDIRLRESGKLIELPASFGKVRAIYWPVLGKQDSMPTVIYMHGNFERIEDSFEMIQPLLRADISVLQVEFPGFGGADGEPTYTNLTESGVVAYDWLVAHADADPKRVVAIGYSIGGGVAAELTRSRPICALILLSTFTSLEEMAHRYLLPGFLLRYPYDTLGRVSEFTCPVLVVHGIHDDVIPFAMGRRLAAISKHGDFIPLDCRHSDCNFEQNLFVERVPGWLRERGLLSRLSADGEKGRRQQAEK